MAANLDPKNFQLVAFDLGGVLVKICRSWQEAAAAAGIDTTLPSNVLTPFTDVSEFDTYQTANIELDGYLAALSEFAGCDVDDALTLHNGILLDPYDGTEELIEELNGTGIRTACLSNTNAAHWEVLIDPNRYPAIANLAHQHASHLMGLHKPNPEIFRVFAQEMGLSPAEIVFFDDDARNIESALQVGFRAHRVDPVSDTASQMRTVLTDLGILSSLP